MACSRGFSDCGGQGEGRGGGRRGHGVRYLCMYVSGLFQYCLISCSVEHNDNYRHVIGQK